MGSHCSHQLQQQRDADLINGETSDHACEKASNYCFPEKKPVESVKTKYEILRRMQLPSQPQSPGSPVKPLNECPPKKTSCPTRRNGISIKINEQTVLRYKRITSTQHRNTFEQNSTHQQTKNICHNNSPKIPHEKIRQRSTRSVVSEKNNQRSNFRIQNGNQDNQQLKQKRTCIIMNSDQSMKKLLIK